MSSLEEWPSQRVVDGMIFCPFFSLFSLILEARSTLLRRLLTDTRPPATLPVVFLPCRRKLWSCWSSVIGAWGLRAWELSALWCAWGPRFAFFKSYSVATSYTASDLHLGGPGDDTCPSRTAVRHLGIFSHCRQLVLGFFAYVFFVFFSCFSSLSLLVLWSNFMGIFVGLLLDQPYFFREWALL